MTMTIDELEVIAAAAEASGDPDLVAEARLLREAAAKNAALAEAVQTVAIAQVKEGDPDALDVLTAAGTA
jgi:hypothetical protein